MEIRPPHGPGCSGRFTMASLCSGHGGVSAGGMRRGGGEGGEEKGKGRRGEEGERLRGERVEEERRGKGAERRDERRGENKEEGRGEEREGLGRKRRKREEAGSSEQVLPDNRCSLTQVPPGTGAPHHQPPRPPCPTLSPITTYFMGSVCCHMH